MIELVTSPHFVIGVFFIVALAYSSVGLGGGSSYTALMAILGFNAVAIPMISLALNLLVTTVGSFNFIRKGYGRIRLIMPFLVTSMPMAYIGGALDLPKNIFYWVLTISLVFVVMRIYFWKDTAFNLKLSMTGKLLLSLAAGCLLGLIAGVAGICGGVYLVPLIIILGLGTEKEIDFSPYLLLMVAVLIGGALGSFIGATRLSKNIMERVLGGIIVVAIMFLILKL